VLLFISKPLVLQISKQQLQLQLKLDQSLPQEYISKTNAESFTRVPRKSIVVDSLKQNSFDKDKRTTISRLFLNELRPINKMAASTYLSVLAAVVALMVGAVYLFGVPPQWKRAMEEKALETMGENKASYLVKGRHSSIFYCFINLANSARFLQIKSTASLRRTRRRSARSSQESEISSEEHSRTPLAKRQDRQETLSLVP